MFNCSNILPIENTRSDLGGRRFTIGCDDRHALCDRTHFHDNTRGMIDNAFICEKHAQVASKGSCTVRVTRKLLEKDVPSEEFSKMLESGKTNLITGFRSRKTRKLFDAFLALDNKGKLRFEFPPREAKVAESN